MFLGSLLTKLCIYILCFIGSHGGCVLCVGFFLFFVFLKIVAQGFFSLFLVMPYFMFFVFFGDFQDSGQHG